MTIDELINNLKSIKGEIKGNTEIRVLCKDTEWDINMLKSINELVIYDNEGCVVIE